MTQKGDHLQENKGVTYPMDLDSGLLYKGVAATPELGAHEDHGIIYTKSDEKLYHLYDKAGRTENRIAFTMAWGTFTPTVTLVGGAGNTVPVYTANSGRYLRIGDLILVDVFLNGDGGDEGAGTGQINIAIPIAGGASVNGDGVGMVGHADNGAGENYPLFGSIAQEGTTITLDRWTSIKVLAALTGDDQDDVARCVNLHFWYEVD
ncbi:hypothetical protein LCGC14_2077240 [marine sediment metagenome]|uniref:Uncharacterized protein n=1 Tax=marine sediment metagenome TaxID=412755 RepID=A0A0F9F405_9ZZZZ